MKESRHPRAMLRSALIARHREALLGIVAAIAALIGGREGGPISRGLRKAALALLRPAEAAARRLIVLAAEGLAVAPRPAQAFAIPPGRGGKGASRPPAFRLVDPPKRHVWRLLPPPLPLGVPRIRTFWGAAHPMPAVLASPPQAAPVRPNPGQPAYAGPLHLRLAALELALADLPRQARRLARWRLRRAPGAGPRPQSPLRLGHPPGHRRRPSHAVDDVLRECHALALDALACKAPPTNGRPRDSS